jgi:POT family proton-dependent oligopeptide transporter
MSGQHSELFKSKVLGHPSGLFVLFFTEMWERFSYYGMRALLVMFLTASLTESGWGWPREHAFALFGTYTALVYVSTMLGGYFADKIWGYRKAVVVGAVLMTMGHAAMALETTWSIYLGLTLLVFGSGFFKPNMTSIISHMYKDHQEKKDGAYTIFYMGVNAGAFLGLAGVFMLFGMIQFVLSQGIFGDIGLKPSKVGEIEPAVAASSEIIDAPVNNEITAEDGSVGRDTLPFPLWQKMLIAVMTTAGLVWILNDPAAMIYDFNVLNFEFLGMSGPSFTILLALVLFLFLLIYRLTQYGSVTRHKMLAVWFFAFLTIFFWAIFEQAPGSLTVFARDYTNRDLAGGAAMTFKIINTLMTIIPLGIITWVLALLFKQTFKKYAKANLVLGFSFVIIWAVAIWMLVVEFQKPTAEVPASWFGVLNSLFIIAMAPLFSKWWEGKYNPSANMKFGIGLSLLGIGMACVAFGAGGIAPGAETAGVSMIWLILVYFFHTMGELCISPVGLSYVSKLVPGKMIAFMFGIWYIAVAIGMKSAGKFSEYSETVAKEEGISYFFWILAIIPIALGVFSVLLTPVIKRLMHGVK